jgi:low affinity Fe/Cu permease
MHTVKAFDTAANAVARVAGSPLAIMVAIAMVIGLALIGPFFHFSQHWQLIVNTFTTIVTFLMVFLIQHTQNGDTAALHIKLDELIRVMAKADKSLLDLEHADRRQIESLRSAYHDIAAKERGGATHTEHAKKTDVPK